MNERLCRLLLWCVEELGVSRLRCLVEEFESAEAAIEAGPDACAAVVGRKSLASRWASSWPRPGDGGDLLECLDSAGISVVARGEEGFPAQLAGLGDPEFMFYRGTIGALSMPLAAVVGTRSVTSEGLRLTQTVTDWCVDRGWAIVSGGALGVDTSAHLRAVERGAATVAVMPAGLDCLVPHRNRRLFEAICGDGGCLVSEHPPRRRPKRTLFARRNRLISGLSRFVVVVRAPRKSGALITVEWARAQGREVFCVPGSPLDPTARGCLDALAQGAKLLGSPGSLPRAEGATPPPAVKGRIPSREAVSPVGGAILGALSRGVSTLDDIAFRVDVKAPVVVIEVTRLLAQGLVEQVGPGEYRTLR